MFRFTILLTACDEWIVPNRTQHVRLQACVISFLLQTKWSSRNRENVMILYTCEMVAHKNLWK